MLNVRLLILSVNAEGSTEPTFASNTRVFGHGKSLRILCAAFAGATVRLKVSIATSLSPSYGILTKNTCLPYGKTLLLFLTVLLAVHARLARQPSH
jgi:hypothetical protein